MPGPTPADGPCASFNGTGCTLSTRSRVLHAPACHRVPWHPQVALGILKRMGCVNVVTAENGEQAVQAVQAAGGPDAFDVILMDLHMPLKARLAVWGGVWGAWDVRHDSLWPGSPAAATAHGGGGGGDAR